MIENVARAKLVDELALAIDQFLTHQIERDTLACGLTQDELTELATGLAAIAAMPTVQAEPVATRWQLGDYVRKKRGSSWRGVVCGFYSTPHTPVGYCVDSTFEPGSVQVWPEAALEDWDGGSDAE